MRKRVLALSSLFENIADAAKICVIHSGDSLQRSLFCYSLSCFCLISPNEINFRNNSIFSHLVLDLFIV